MAWFLFREILPNAALDADRRVRPAVRECGDLHLPRCRSSGSASSRPSPTSAGWCGTTRSPSPSDASHRCCRRSALAVLAIRGEPHRGWHVEAQRESGSAMRPTPVLRISGLRVEARVRRQGHGPVWRPIVDGVDVTLDRGEVLGLIGETGAGKSTLGLAAMGYARRGCRISGGEIVLDGVELRTAPPEVLHDVRGRKVAYVAQSAAAAFNPRAPDTRPDSGGDAHPRRLRQRRRAGTCSGSVRPRMALLPNPATFGDRYPHEVSGGQLQRAP